MNRFTWKFEYDRYNSNKFYYETKLNLFIRFLLYVWRLIMFHPTMAFKDVVEDFNFRLKYMTCFTIQWLLRMYIWTSHCLVKQFMKHEIKIVKQINFNFIVLIRYRTNQATISNTSWIKIKMNWRKVPI